MHLRIIHLYFHHVNLKRRLISVSKNCFKLSNDPNYALPGCLGIFKKDETWGNAGESGGKEEEGKTEEDLEWFISMRHTCKMRYADCKLNVF